jgi:hypothetical protein
MPPAGSLFAAETPPASESRCRASTTDRAPNADRVPALSNRQRPSARAPLGDQRMPRPPPRSPTHATGTKPMKVAARWPLLPPVARFFLVSHTPPHGPFTGLTPFLSNRVSGPSCASRHLFRRHHLRLQQGLAGHRQTPLLGISKDRPSVVRCWRVHSHRGVCPAREHCCQRQPPKLRNQRSHRRSMFRLRGFSPP